MEQLGIRLQMQHIAALMREHVFPGSTDILISCGIS